MRLCPQNLVTTCSRDFDFKLDDWNQMHYCRHILLAVSTTSCLILEFESVLESLHSAKCDCLLRIRWRRVLSISISSWMTGTRCIFADSFCWLSQQPQVWSWNLKVSWKVCIQPNATVSSEFGGNVFSRFRWQVGWLEPDAFFQHILLAISTTSCRILEFESVLESLHSGNATVSSELGGDVFSRFRFQVGLTLNSYLAREKTTCIVTEQQIMQHI